MKLKLEMQLLLILELTLDSKSNLLKYRIIDDNLLVYSVLSQFYFYLGCQ